MASSSALSVDDYLASLPADRRAAISAVRSVIRKNLPKGFEEGMQYGMIGYYVPLSRYPKTYNGQALPIASLASQKGYMAVYLMGVYGDPATAEWFEEAYCASGKRLDMGKSCVRFRKVDDLPLDVIGQTIARIGVDAFLTRYEEVRAQTTSGKPAAAKKPAAPAPAKKPSPSVTEKPAAPAAAKKPSPSVTKKPAGK